MLVWNGSARFLFFTVLPQIQLTTYIKFKFRDVSNDYQQALGVALALNESGHQPLSIFLALLWTELLPVGMQECLQCSLPYKNDESFLLSLTGLFRSDLVSKNDTFFDLKRSPGWLESCQWRTVVGEWRFDNDLCGSHLQSQVLVLVSWKPWWAIWLVNRY